MRALRSLGVALATLVPAAALAMGGPSPGAVTAQTVKLPPGPGSVRGLADTAQVRSFTGQVQYAVPIPLPEGRNGLTPALSLGYDGNLGNGPLGVGWSLAQAEIRRSTRLGIPRYDATDELELFGLGAGGQIVRLANGELRVEGAGNAFTGRQLAGGYELTDAAGRVYRFGTTAAARKASGAKVSTWYLEEIRDVAGGAIAYRYGGHKGEVYLEAIEWGPVVNGAPAFRAALEYEARTDAVVSYRTGFRVEAGRRLARVRVWSLGAVQRIVELGYDAQFSLSRVNQVRVTSGDGSLAQPPLAFAYALPLGSALAAVPGIAGWALNLQGTSLFDVDSDGAMDLLRLTATGHSWRRNLGGTFAAAAPLPGAAGASLDQARLVDLDGDSVAEMVLQQGSQWVVHKLDRAAAKWVALGTLSGATDVSLGGVAIADIDGDQRMDVLSPAGGQLQLRIGGAAGLGAAVLKPPIDSDPTRAGIGPGSTATSFYDLNGDGLADAIHQSTSAFFLYLGKGDGTFERYVDAPYPWTGSFSTSQVRLGDLDRDGLLDAVLVSAGNVAMYRGRANGTFATTPVSVARPAGTDATIVVAIADTNGNGSEDVVWSSDAGMWILDLAGPTTAGMLREIDDGLGRVQRIGYQASTALMFAAQAGGAAWTRTMPISVPVAVTNRFTLASGEPPRSARLDVRDGIYDPVERRFIGFEGSTLTRPDPADGAPAAQTIRTVTRYAPGLGAERVLRGQITSERIEDGAGVVLRETVHTVAAHAIAGLPATDPRLRRAVVLATEARHFEGMATPIATRVERTFDPEGREIERVDRGRLDLTGDETIARTRYTEGRSTRGVRDLVCEASRWAPGSPETLVSHTQTRFGDDLTVAPLCDASAGWARETREYLASEARWITTRATQYAASGLPLQDTSGGVTRALAYDAHGLRPASETVAPTPGKALVWAMEWNQVLQTPTRVVDADGAALVLTHDGLSRLTAVAREGFAPHLRHVYHAAGPRPYLETLSFDGAIDAVPATAEPWTPGSGWRHTVEVMTSAGEPLFRATRVDAARWLVAERRQRDAIGRTIAIAQPYEHSGTLDSLVASALPAGVAVRTVAYDALDRATLQTLPTGAKSVHAFRAFETTATTDGLAPVTTFLDGQGRIRRTERTVGGAVEAVDATYDAAGRLTAMRIPMATGAVVHAFTYDTLGRLIAASDPDAGARELVYDDAGRLVEYTNGAAQTTVYAYDGAGRLTAVTAADDAALAYHYDDALDPTAFGYTGGRLAWVEEPTGTVQHGYDAFGRAARVRRTVHGRTADQLTTFGASGLALAVSDGDGFVLPMSYDAAGRPVQLGALWQLEEQDAAGLVLRERFGNGVVQSYERDVLGRPTRIRIRRPSGGASIYDAAIARNAFGGITTVTDEDGTGLDHTAAFSYDGGGRLTAATIGTGAAAWSFTYAYDRLQNMTARTAQGPGSPRILAGQYRYGEPAANGDPRSPRQLTSVAPPGGGPATQLDYDGAGRVVRRGALTMTYNDFDQLLTVSGVPGPNGQPATVSYAYGHDGLRVSTIAPGGAETIRFTPAITERADGTRELDVRLGERLIARVTRTPIAPAVDAAAEDGGGGGTGAIGAVGGALLGLAAGLARWRARRRRGALGFALAAAALAIGCGGAPPATSRAAQPARATTRIAYYHTTIAAGPSIITREDGSILDERRDEPFGAGLDSRQELPGGGAQTGPVDHARDPHDSLNKETDPATGWSDHGARWLAPETARWLTPDPPVKAPDPAFMARPWALHPYQYVEQNPIVYWDPDGRDRVTKTSASTKVIEAAQWEHKTDHTEARTGVAEVSVRPGELEIEVALAKAQLKSETTLGGERATMGVEGTLGSATLTVSTDEITVGFSVFEIKGELGISETKVGGGFGVSGDLEISPTRIHLDLKLGFGVELETSPKDIMRAGAALGRGIDLHDTIRQVREQHRADEWRASGPHETPAPIDRNNPLVRAASEASRSPNSCEPEPRR